MSHPIGTPKTAGSGIGLKLNNELIENICKALRMGTPIVPTCQYAGITKSTFDDYMREGFIQSNRRAHGDELDDRAALFADLYDKTEEAQGAAIVRNVLHISKAAESQWQAGAWMLERTHPELFALVQRNVNVNLNPESLSPDDIRQAVEAVKREAIDVTPIAEERLPSAQYPELLTDDMDYIPDIGSNIPAAQPEPEPILHEQPKALPAIPETISPIGKNKRKPTVSDAQVKTHAPKPMNPDEPKKPKKPMTKQQRAKLNKYNRDYYKTHKALLKASRHPILDGTHVNTPSKPPPT